MSLGTKLLVDFGEGLVRIEGLETFRRQQQEVDVRLITLGYDRHVFRKKRPYHVGSAPAQV